MSEITCRKIQLVSAVGYVKGTCVEAHAKVQLNSVRLVCGRQGKIQGASGKGRIPHKLLPQCVLGRLHREPHERIPLHAQYTWAPHTVQQRYIAGGISVTQVPARRNGMLL